ncbi:MAG: CHAT domain-containing protein [Aphanocapsa sp. GSE-SYN-MK-11-07L]|nr:CHAT domain-containing protein [Aphanocapsa sp. GSE-SYN-MK-11-07L]
MQSSVLSLLLALSGGWGLWDSPAIAQTSPTPSQSAAINAKAELLEKQGDYEGAIAHWQSWINQLKQSANPNLEQLALAWNRLGQSYRAKQDFPAATEPLTQAVATAQAAGKTQLQTISLLLLGRNYADLAQYDQAIAHYKAAEALAQSAQYPVELITVQNNIASVLVERGEFATALALLETSQAAAHTLQQPYAQDLAIAELPQRCAAAETMPRKLLEALLQKGCEYINRPEIKAKPADLQAVQQIVVKAYNQNRPIFYSTLRTLEATTLENIGVVKSSLGDPEAALVRYQDALQIRLELEVPTGLANAANNIANSVAAIGNDSLALEWYQRSLAANQADPQPDSTALTLSNMSQIYERRGEYPKALELLQQALKLARQQFDRSTEATIINNIGGIQLALSQYPDAMVNYQQALALNRAIGKRRSEGTSYNNIATLYSIWGKPDEASAYYQKSLEIARQIGVWPDQANRLTNLGATYSDRAQFAKALDYLNQALALSQKNAGQANADLVATYSNLAIIQRHLGRYQAAIASLKTALKIAQARQLKNEEAISLRELGGVYLELKNYDAAQTALTAALKLHQTFPNRIGEIRSLRDLGRLALSQHQPQIALPYLQLADRHVQSIGAVSLIGLVQSELGRTYLALQQPEQGQQVLRQAIAAAATADDQPTQGKALTDLGQSLLDADQPDQAAKLLWQAIEIWESARVGLSDADKVSLFETQQSTYQLLQRALVRQGNTNAALEVAERGRARAFLEQLAAKANLSPAQLQQLKAPSLEEIRQIARRQQATLVQYSQVSSQDILIWVIQPNGEIHFQTSLIPPPLKSLESLVSNSRSQINLRSRTSSSNPVPILQPGGLPAVGANALQQLYQVLIAPIQANLPQNPDQSVIFIPQGSLFLVPFAALEDTEAKPLIERHTISITPALQALNTKSIPPRSPSKPSVLVVGNPTMPIIEGNKLPPLPAAEIEAKQIAQLFSTKALVGDQPTKPIVIKQMQQSNLIHLATHGLMESFNGEVPGAIVLAGKTETDGLLTSSEILDLKLQADLVVLSACDTGRGKITGDGVIGLSRSLFLAGVPSVVVSLWSVNDQSTSVLMTEFYRNWHERNLTKAQALRQAMLTTKQRFPDPIDWAAFNLMGHAN